MTEKQCPICKGNGVAISARNYNRVVHFGDGKNEEEPCWMCGGVGRVLEDDAPHNIHLHKYWMIKEE